MPRFATRTPPTYEQAKAEYYFKPYGMYRYYWDSVRQQQLYDGDKNLLELWPTHVTVNGHQWPFLKVVYLLQHKVWPEGPVSYPHEPCKPGLITTQ